MRAAAVIFAFMSMLYAGLAVADDAGRYQLVQRDDGSYLRVDRKTGEVSTCVQGTGGLTCRLAADERAALQAEIDRLAAERDGMRAKLDTLEGQITSLRKDFAELRQERRSSRLSDEDLAKIDRVFSFIEETAKRVDRLAKDLKESWEGN